MLTFVTLVVYFAFFPADALMPDFFGMRVPVFGSLGLLLPTKTSRDVIDIVSYGLVYMLGTAGLPHILIRFFTTRDGASARRSLGWAMGVMGVFFLMVVLIGIGARALLTGDVVKLASAASVQHEARVARIATAALGIVATVATILIGSSFNITFLLGLAFLVAASSNLPVLLPAAVSVPDDPARGPYRPSPAVRSFNDQEATR